MSTKTLFSKAKSAIPAPVKKAESVVHHKLESAMWKNIMRVVFVLHIVATKKLPATYLAYTDLMWVRVLIALVIVYLAYIDIISAALLGALFILSVQEYKSRQSAQSLYLSVANTGSKVSSAADKLHLSVAMGQKTAGPSSSSSVNKQIGMLDVGVIKPNPLIDDPQDNYGPGYIKVNMGQSSTDPLDKLISAHPAAHTLSENIKLNPAGFITDKNLVDAQINSAQGADVEVPCAVESIYGSYNAQGLGIPMPLSSDRCNNSKVI